MPGKHRQPRAKSRAESPENCAESPENCADSQGNCADCALKSQGPSFPAGVGPPLPSLARITTVPQPEATGSQRSKTRGPAGKDPRPVGKPRSSAGKVRRLAGKVRRVAGKSRRFTGRTNRTDPKIRHCRPENPAGLSFFRRFSHLKREKQKRTGPFGAPP